MKTSEIKEKVSESGRKYANSVFDNLFKSGEAAKSSPNFTCVDLHKAFQSGAELGSSLFAEYNYSKNEVCDLIQMIYSEFAELPIRAQNQVNLMRIIKQEVEQHPLKPIKIFR